MNANLDDQQYLNEDIILTSKDEKFYLRLQNLALLVKGDDLNSAYQELIKKKNERIKIMKELNLKIPESQLTRVNSANMLEFFLKTMIVVGIFSVIIGFVGIILGNVMESRTGQLSSIAKRNATELITLPFDILQHRIVPYYVNRIKNAKPTSILEKALHEEAMKNPIEPERQEKIIKDLRAVVHRLKPFIEEIKPLLKGEKPNSP